MPELYSTVANPRKVAQRLPNAGRGRGNGNQVVRPQTGASMPKNAIGKRKVNKLRTALWLRTNEVDFFRLFRF